MEFDAATVVDNLRQRAKEKTEEGQLALDLLLWMAELGDKAEKEAEGNRSTGWVAKEAREVSSPSEKRFLSRGRIENQVKNFLSSKPQKVPKASPMKQVLRERIPNPAPAFSQMRTLAPVSIQARLVPLGNGEVDLALYSTLPAGETRSLLEVAHPQMMDCMTEAPPQYYGV